MTAHQFQTPHVEPLAGCERLPQPMPEQEAQPRVLLRVAPADAERILRALEQAGLVFAPAPGGARGATAYRRLAAEIRTQANLATAGQHRALRTAL